MGQNKKAEMMSKKEAYKVIDVFAGPGGLGEGFVAFGYRMGKFPFKLAVSIEKDPTAHSTLMLRSFYRQFSQDNIPKEYWAYARGDIAKTELFNLYPTQAKAAAAEAQCISVVFNSFINIVAERSVIKRSKIYLTCFASSGLTTSFRASTS